MSLLPANVSATGNLTATLSMQTESLYNPYTGTGAGHIAFDAKNTLICSSGLRSVFCVAVATNCDCMLGESYAICPAPVPILPLYRLSVTMLSLDVKLPVGFAI